MKIVFLSASGALGGAERVLLDVLASLRAAEPSWRLAVVSGEDGPLLGHVRQMGCEARVLPFPRALSSLGDAGGGRAALLAGMAVAAPGVALYLARLRSLLRALAADVVHSNGYKMHLLGAWAAPAGMPLVWHLHDFLSTRRAMAGLLRRSAHRCAAAIAVSRAVADDARAVLGGGLRVDVVLNATDLSRFRPDGPALALHELAGLPPEPPGTVRVGLVATMGRWKGHTVFLRAISLLRREMAVRAYVVGGGIYRTAGSEVSPDELRALAAELGIGGRVGFTGFIDDAAAVVRGLDVVVHASTQPEPFGLVIAEAMACGRPVVVSAAGGAGEIVTDGHDALAVPPGDAPALARAIERLAADATLRATLGRNGRDTAILRFDRARLASALAPLYRSLVSR